MQHLAQKSFLLQKALGKQPNYQAFLKLQQIHFKNGRKPTFYSEPTENQLKLDVQLLKEQIQLFNKLSVQKEIYKFLPMKGFGPGYALLVHQLYFRLFEKFARKQFKDRQPISKMSIIGSFFNKKIRTDSKKVKDNQKVKGVAKENKIQIQMEEEEWFYSRFTSIHTTSAVVLLQKDGNIFPVYVRLRNRNGELLPNVRTKFFGHNISSQHFLIGFNINGYEVQPSDFLDQNWKPEQLISIRRSIEYNQLFLSLLDLYRSCDITIRYTSMRKQFRTIPQSKEERKIIQYQAVASRIAEGLSTAFMIASLLNIDKSGFTDYYQYGHQVILDQLVSLRQCCGGFGYLKVSGHPLVIERVALRASEIDRNPIFPIPKITIKQFSPYVINSDENVKFQCSKQKPRTQMNYYLITSQYKLLEPKTPNEQAEYVFDFFKCCCIQQFQRSEHWNSFRKNITNINQLCKYICAVEGLKDSQYIHMQFMKQKSKQQVLDTMVQMKRRALSNVSKNFQKFRECLPVIGLEDTVCGRANQTQFYEQVLKTSRQNYRNSREFIDEVKKPIVEYLRNGNSGNL